MSGIPCPPDVPVLLGDLVTVAYPHQAPITARVVGADHGANYYDVGRVTVEVTATSSHYWAHGTQHTVGAWRLTLRRRAR